jgi:hypothetical protein
LAEPSTGCAVNGLHFLVDINRLYHVSFLWTWTPRSAEGAIREVPSYCFSEMTYTNQVNFETSALLTSLRGGLCLFVLEGNGISAWTPEAETTTWSRQFMLTRTELEARAVLDVPHGFTYLRLHAYGERSGTMILEVTPCVFLRLDIGEGFNLARLVRLGSEDRSFGKITFLCLHEIHLVSLLRSMKSFPQGAQGTFSSKIFLNNVYLMLALGREKFLACISTGIYTRNHSTC